jgi:aryl-alcohol dehydrogenase
MQVTAAVLEEHHKPLNVQQLEIDEPRAGEVLVRIVASGVCHTDAIAQEANFPFPIPGVLGHEGAGIVEAVGDGVTKVAPGDKVIIGWPWCGECRNCQAGRHRFCLSIGPLVGAGVRLQDGSSCLSRKGEVVHGHFFGQSSFSTYSITTERAVVKVPDDAPIELLGPLGCGLATGAGAILNALRPEAGSVVAIFGTGAVGLAATMAARLTGARSIIAVDVIDHRLALAKELGATETINARETDPVAAIREIAGQGSLGADYALECTGNMDVLRQSVDCLNMPGTALIIGGAPANAEFTLDHLTTLWGRTVRGTLGGEGQSDVLLPTLLELYGQGRFPFDRLVQFFSLEEVNEAMEASARGDVLKPVLRMG